MARAYHPGVICSNRSNRKQCLTRKLMIEFRSIEELVIHIKREVRIYNETSLHGRKMTSVIDAPLNPNKQTRRQFNFRGKKYTLGLLAAFSRWLAHPYLTLGGVQLPLRVLQLSQWIERTQIRKTNKQTSE